MAKYKVGDKVRVRSDLEVDKYYGIPRFVDYMKVYLGKLVTIEYDADDDGTYKIEEDEGCWWWSNEMFEGFAEEPKFNVFDTVKHIKFGIGTVIETDKLSSGKEIYKIEFDEWNEDFPNFNENVIWIVPNDLTLIKAYSPN